MNSRIRTPFYIFFLNPDYVARSLRSLRSNKQMIGQMAIARALPRFNDLGRSVAPIFLSMDHFLY